MNWTAARQRGLLLLAWVVVGLFSTTATCAELARAKNVVLFHGSEATAVLFDASLRESFRSPADGETQFFTEYIDSARFVGPEHAERLATFLHDRYAGTKIDLIFASGPVALTYLLKYRDQMLPGVPVVFLDVRKATLATKRLPADFVGVGAEIDAEPVLRLALRLRPATRELVLLFGTTEFDQVWEGRLRDAAAKVAPELPIRSVSSLPIEEVGRALAALGPEAVILGGAFSRDGAGRYFPGSVTVLRRVQPTARAPVFHITMNAVGNGAVGSVGVPADALTNQASTIAKAILAGTPPSEVKLPEPLSMHPYVDWRELRRWRISEDLLPADAVVLFREPSFWDRYRYHALAAIALIVLQAALIATLLIEARKRKGAELQAHVQRHELAHLSRVAMLSAMSLSVAHELNQPLGAILSNAQAAQLFLQQDPADLAEVVESLDAIIRNDQRAGEIIANLRRMLSKEEVPKQALDISEVVGELSKLVESELIVRQARLEAHVADDCPPVLADRTQLLQVLINLVINACDAMERNAPGARLVVIGASKIDGGVRLSVEDQGGGVPSHLLEGTFTPFLSTKEKGLGMGLAVCSSIVESHGGQLRVTNKASGGAVFTFDLPASTTRVSGDTAAALV
ncbi:MAG: hypothetical protein K8R60_08190 [Burkholderiales bacterium]|nr:hypothetical protein [Burkholderiales bacterium]